MTASIELLAFPIVRSNEMSLMNEALARAHCYERLSLAENQRVAKRQYAAKRAQRRAERAAARARRLANLASAFEARVH